MHQIFKSATVSYSCKQMYQLVNQIDDYPQFINWCSSARILNQTKNEIVASVSISKGMLNQTFTTINTLIPDTRINMKLKDGPFKQLNGAWIFTPLNENACTISLELEFSFSSKFSDMVISPVFSAISNAQLSAFIARAKQVYG